MGKRQTELDYAVIAINPALIMLLVGSLVLFLLELFYRGPYMGRMQFIMGDFVFACVLLSRLTIEEGFEKSGRLGGIFAFVMLLALWRFVPDAVWLGLILLVVIWWCANRLTFDCTLVDDSRDTSQKGLMQWIGADFDSLGSEPEKTPPQTQVAADEEPEKKRSWLWDVLDPTSTRFAPGVWIIYFSMAALPLFGLGQAFEPSGDASLRWRLFLYLFTYVASALGLLMSTSFLSLRRYLGKRNLEMPTSMVGIWLGTGAVLIAVVMLVTAILPRPHAEYEVAKIPSVGEMLKRAASNYAVGKDGTQDDEKQGTTESNDQQQAGKEQKEAGDGDQGEKSETQTKSGDGDKQSSSGKKSDQGKSGDDKSQKSQNQGDQKNDSSSQKSDSQSAQQQSDQKSEQKSDSGKSQQQSQSDGEKSDTQKSDGEQSNDNNKSEQQPNENKSSENQSSQNNAAKPPSEAPKPPQPSSPPFNLMSLVGSLGYLVKLIIYGAVALAALYFAWKFRAQIAESWAKFVDDMRKLWDYLFGRRTQPVLATAEAAPVAKTPLFPAFASPFAPGAKKRSPEQLVRYTFQALEAWGADKGVPRDSDQTVEEFARRLASEFSNTEIGPLARELARQYDEVAYGSGKAPREATECAQRLWRNLQSAY
ncbi:DUF4129 domain-containing protein [Blastopirellula sp. JC732]|uniref:DUF4129 domain-containing protein n=1 Tax=Blastopirellula sediminis TaxID=2894196 RepID=A0A9X1MM14_9BACT|nr:DUF4129 domain-containing protein [Blastopirellula sediminis]MCC9608851.1 DUF4129 domain-containing protein [Blastopirellula sediminis]MCC9628372.1 DUF4129 domain-containing protein [Blastopirellula sediminis]